MADKPKRVRAKSVYATSNNKTNKRELWARICYHYPQYTLKEASELPVRDIKLLLKVARQIQAENKYDYTQIAAAPHTKKGSGVKKLTEHFKKQMD